MRGDIAERARALLDRMPEESGAAEFVWFAVEEGLLACTDGADTPNPSFEVRDPDLLDAVIAEMATRGWG